MDEGNRDEMKKELREKLLAHAKKLKLDIEHAEWTAKGARDALAEIERL